MTTETQVWAARNPFTDPCDAARIVTKIVGSGPRLPKYWGHGCLHGCINPPIYKSLRIGKVKRGEALHCDIAPATDISGRSKDTDQPKDITHEPTTKLADKLISTQGSTTQPSLSASVPTQVFKTSSLKHPQT